MRLLHCVFFSATLIFSSIAIVQAAEAEVSVKKVWDTRYSFEFDHHTVLVDLGEHTRLEKVTGSLSGGKHVNVYLNTGKEGSGFKIAGYPVDRVSATLNGKRIAPAGSNANEKPEWVEFVAADIKGEYVATLKAAASKDQR